MYKSEASVMEVKAGQGPRQHTEESENTSDRALSHGEQNGSERDTNSGRRVGGYV